MVRIDPDPHAGAGDTLMAEPDTLVWQSGNDAFYLTVAPRAVHLEGGRAAILVSQRAGVDHPKRRHVLFARDDAKLVAAWSAEEPSGPTWSATRVIRVAGAADRILFYDARMSGGSTADSIGVSIVQWDEKAKRATQAKDDWPPGVSVVRLGAFATLRQARAAQQKLSNCLDVIWVLKAADYGVQGGRPYFIGGLTSESTAAASLQARGAPCDPTLQVSAQPYERR
jgi:hypothetical protein